MKGHWGGILGRDDDANFTRAAGCEGANAGASPAWLLSHMLPLGRNFGQEKLRCSLTSACSDVFIALEGLGGFQGAPEYHMGSHWLKFGTI